jgi:inorganic pyrophosphatase
MDKREKIIQEHMGKHVRVVVDRPMGHIHGDLAYPINYGYIPGVFAEDGEEQDAYILGVSEPVEVFEGRVIGVVRRKNDCEDKLVVAPEGMRFHQGEITKAVWFQERWFKTAVDAVLRKSCGVVPFRRNPEGELEVLLLFQRWSKSWSCPKGHMDAGETEEQTALRELHEETGMTARLVPGARAAVEYRLTSASRKQVVLFLGEVRGDLHLQAREIENYAWVKPEALDQYLHPDSAAACCSLLDQLK